MNTRRIAMMVVRVTVAILLCGAEIGCKGEPVENVLTPEVVSYDAQAGATLGGLEDPLTLAEDPGAFVPLPVDPGTTRSQYDPERHHVAPEYEPTPPACAAAPFGVGGPSNLLRSAQTLSGTTYSLHAVSLAPSRPRSASSASYQLTNIMVKEVETCD